MPDDFFQIPRQRQFERRRFVPQFVNVSGENAIGKVCQLAGGQSRVARYAHNDTRPIASERAPASGRASNCRAAKRLAHFGSRFIDRCNDRGRSSTASIRSSVTHISMIIRANRDGRVLSQRASCSRAVQISGRNLIRLPSNDAGRNGMPKAVALLLTASAGLCNASPMVRPSWPRSAIRRRTVTSSGEKRRSVAIGVSS